jgi:hypothetical protein
VAQLWAPACRGQARAAPNVATTGRPGQRRRTRMNARRPAGADRPTADERGRAQTLVGFRGSRTTLVRLAEAGATDEPDLGSQLLH